MLQKEESRENLTQNSVLPKKCCRISPYLATTSSFSSLLLPLLTITSVTPCFPGNMHCAKKGREEKSQITSFSKGIIRSYFVCLLQSTFQWESGICVTVKDCFYVGMKFVTKFWWLQDHRLGADGTGQNKYCNLHMLIFVSFLSCWKSGSVLRTIENGFLLFWSFCLLSSDSSIRRERAFLSRDFVRRNL